MAKALETRSSLALLVLVCACAAESDEEASVDGGFGAAGGFGGAMPGVGGTVGECDCARWEACQDGIYTRRTQGSCGCNVEVIECANGCDPTGAGCIYECNGVKCPNINPTSIATPGRCCTMLGECGVKGTYSSDVDCAPIYPAGDPDPDCPLWKGKHGCCRPGVNLCGVLDPAAGAGCVDPRALGIRYVHDCSGQVVDAGADAEPSDAGGTFDGGA